MRFTGKLIGAVLGFVLTRGSWAGVLMGVFLGHTFDRRATRQKPIDIIHTSTAMQSQFSRASFLIMGKLAKADGPVNEQELDLARQIMATLKLSEQQRNEAMALFTEGKQPEFKIDDVLTSLRETIGRRTALAHFFLEMQIALAYVDGALNAPERVVLQQICAHLRVGSLVFDMIHQRVVAQFAYQKFHSQQQQGKHSVPLKGAYAILGVPADSPDTVVKKAYRKLMSEHHPDKLVANGLPPEMENIAKEKSQEIQQAYSAIRQSRKSKT